MKNYSLCTENFGVVPLFSLAFFLFLPALFNLSFLLVRVFIVLEPIKLSLSYSNYIFFKKRFVTFMVSIVKIFLIGSALQQSAYAKSPLTQDIFLSRGEQIDIKINNLKSYSVGNKQVVSLKYSARNKQIYIKAKSIGFSDLVIWNSKNEKTQYLIYVISKKNQLEQMKFIASLKNSKLRTETLGDYIKISGKVDNQADYTLIQKISHLKLKNILLDLTIDNNFKNLIIGEVYFDLYKQGAKYVFCDFDFIYLNCSIKSKNNNLNLQRLINDYGVRFNFLNSFEKNKNYNIKFNIVSVESSNHHSNTLGVNRLEGKVQDIIDSGEMKFLTNNLLMSEENTSAYLLSNPDMNITVVKPFKISLGQEIPLKINKRDETIIEWKFAGIKLAGKIEEIDNHFLLTINSEITAPNGENISGPKNSASIYLEKEKSFKVFSYDITHKHMVNEGIPGLNEIPFLNSLFSAKKKITGNKKVIVFISIKEVLSE